MLTTLHFLSVFLFVLVECGMSVVFACFLCCAVRGSGIEDRTSPLSPHAQVALFWILGHFGKSIPRAPYVIETYIDSLEELDSAAQMALLTCTMRLFFLRPPEVHSMLGRLLSVTTAEIHNADVFDRALVYYRLLQVPIALQRRSPSVCYFCLLCKVSWVSMRDELLQHDVKKAEEVVAAHMAPVPLFTEDHETEIQVWKCVFPGNSHQSSLLRQAGPSEWHAWGGTRAGSPV